MLCIPSARFKRGAARADFPGHPSHDIVVNQRKVRHHLCQGLLLLGLAALAYPLQNILTILLALVALFVADSTLVPCPA